MGSAPHQPVDVDPQALEKARHFWDMFTHFIKYGVIAVMALLALMAIFVA